MLDTAETLTPAEKLADRLGFGAHYSPKPEGWDGMKGEIIESFDLRLSLLDRLRLLITGKLHVAAIVRTDRPAPDNSRAVFVWQIAPPFEGEE